VDNKAQAVGDCSRTEAYSRALVSSAEAACDIVPSAFRVAAYLWILVTMGWVVELLLVLPLFFDAGFLKKATVSVSGLWMVVLG
jgi:hypothetical protein